MNVCCILALAGPVLVVFPGIPESSGGQHESCQWACGRAGVEETSIIDIQLSREFASVAVFSDFVVGVAQEPECLHIPGERAFCFETIELLVQVITNRDLYDTSDVV